MITLREIVYGIYGAYRLCRFDPQGTVYLDDTVAGFWRSFFSAVLIVPPTLILTLIEWRNAAIAGSIAHAIILEALAYVILVFAYPLAAFYLCRMMGRGERYILFIVASNWSSVIQIALLLPVTALGASELLPADLFFFISLAADVLIFAMAWYIARTTLQIGGVAAAGMVLVDLAIVILVRNVTDGRLVVA